MQALKHCSCRHRPRCRSSRSIQTHGCRCVGSDAQGDDMVVVSMALDGKVLFENLWRRALCAVVEPGPRLVHRGSASCSPVARSSASSDYYDGSSARFQHRCSLSGGRLSSSHSSTTSPQFRGVTTTTTTRTTTKRTLKSVIR